MAIIDRWWPVPDDPRTVTRVDQFVIHDEGQRVFIRFHPGMKLASLRKAIARQGINAIKMVWLHRTEQHWGELGALLAELMPGKRLEELPAAQPGVHTVPGRTRLVVNAHYFRALAKIAFHYLLSQTRQGLRGDEPEFEGIRRFIRYGEGEVDDFFHSSGRSVNLPFPRGYYLPPMVHRALTVDVAQSQSGKCPKSIEPRDEE